MRKFCAVLGNYVRVHCNQVGPWWPMWPCCQCNCILHYEL
uniref:Uncharacterized protein n=1 Tax=Arundo donax TaxID=35708 RepID=A0A0A8Z2W2_ARUDO